VISPVRDEAHNLGRLAVAMAAQTTPPDGWVIVDTGSSDSTLELVRELASQHSFIKLVEAPDAGGLARGGAITRGFQAGLDSLSEPVDVVVKLDADVSFEPDYFARLLDEFARDPKLGMTSGSCHELEGGVWKQRHVTGTTVWGASRAYRRPCLDAILPLEQRMGWDGIDEHKAISLGWHAHTCTDVPFHHHRREGERDGSKSRARRAQGRAAWYMGYRPWYLALRSLHHARREPAALAMMLGYLESALRREPRLEDQEVRRYIRRHQSPLQVPRRALEAFGLGRTRTL
jgi:glycosyltransferase involved in cell wall biosynthesis